MSGTCVSCRLNTCSGCCVPTTDTSPLSAHWNSEAPSKNTHNGLFALRACYIMHGMLVMIHIVLFIFYVLQWENYATLSFTSINSDIWSAMLSASLQAFYTVRVHDIRWYPNHTLMI
ncbi:hypothetical protein BDR06DRAFT_333012 [Suillus hirtellus]|nr:hypothetical protein BDR06DRAFT_333012 [Suillus hirtellus]